MELGRERNKTCRYEGSTGSATRGNTGDALTFCHWITINNYFNYLNSHPFAGFIVRSITDRHFPTKMPTLPETILLATSSKISHGHNLNDGGVGKTYPLVLY